MPRGWPARSARWACASSPGARPASTRREAIFAEQAAGLAEGGVDLFVLETFRDVNEIGAAIRAIRSVSDRPIVAMLTTAEDGNTLDGTPVEQFGPQLVEFGADVLGVNCSVGPAAMLDTIERLAKAVPGALLAAMPNAGKPRDVDGRNLYLCSPDYMASYARRFAGAGVRLIGGCCGTTPDHVKQIAHAVHALAAPVPAASAVRRRRAGRAAGGDAGARRGQVATVERAAARALRDRHRTGAAGRASVTIASSSRRAKRASTASTSCS